jgi:DNA-binding HxlR family transcriptional regulator
MACSIAQCLEVVGDWWSLLIVRDAFRGITRFADLEADLGISRNVLTQRLAYLVDEGILERVAYSDHPPRYYYQLTDKGRDLFPVLTAMRQWGDRWAAPDGPPIEVVHDRCGNVSDAVLTCSECGERLVADEIHRVPGPGTPTSTRAAAVHPRRSRAPAGQPRVKATARASRKPLRQRSR